MSLDTDVELARIAENTGTFIDCPMPDHSGEYSALLWHLLNAYHSIGGQSSVQSVQASTSVSSKGLLLVRASFPEFRQYRVTAFYSAIEQRILGKIYNGYTTEKIFTSAQKPHVSLLLH
jgi:hypothetical protein